MIKSLTNLENIKLQTMWNRKIPFFGFCFVLFFWKLGYKSAFFDRKSVKKFWPVPLYWTKFLL